LQPNSGPHLLAFDTSDGCLAGAIVRMDQDTVVLTSQVIEMAKGQVEKLPGFLDNLMAAASLGWADIGGIGVGIGPGNFTGIRIAVSHARGLAMGLDIPAVGVSRFETTMHLANTAQVVVPGPRDQQYFMDIDHAVDPVLRPAGTAGAFALSTDHSAQDHINKLAQLAVPKVGRDGPPKPMYVKPADAAPSKIQAPTLVP